MNTSSLTRTVALALTVFLGAAGQAQTTDLPAISGSAGLGFAWGRAEYGAEPAVTEGRLLRTLDLGGTFPVWNNKLARFSLDVSGENDLDTRQEGGISYLRSGEVSSGALSAELLPFSRVLALGAGVAVRRQQEEVWGFSADGPWEERESWVRGRADLFKLADLSFSMQERRHNGRYEASFGETITNTYDWSDSVMLQRRFERGRVSLGYNAMERRDLTYVEPDRLQQNTTLRADTSPTDRLDVDALYQMMDLEVGGRKSRGVGWQAHLGYRPLPTQRLSVGAEVYRLPSLPLAATKSDGTDILPYSDDEMQRVYLQDRYRVGWETIRPWGMAGWSYTDESYTPETGGDARREQRHAGNITWRPSHALTLLAAAESWTTLSLAPAYQSSRLTLQALGNWSGSTRLGAGLSVEAEPVLYPGEPVLSLSWFGEKSGRWPGGLETLLRVGAITDNRDLPGFRSYNALASLTRRLGPESRIGLELTGKGSNLPTGEETRTNQANVHLDWERDLWRLTARYGYEEMGPVDPALRTRFSWRLQHGTDEKIYFVEGNLARRLSDGAVASVKDWAAATTKVGVTVRF